MSVTWTLMGIVALLLAGTAVPGVALAQSNGGGLLGGLLDKNQKGQESSGLIGTVQNLLDQNSTSVNSTMLNLDLNEGFSFTDLAPELGLQQAAAQQDTPVNDTVSVTDQAQGTTSQASVSKEQVISDSIDINDHV